MEALLPHTLLDRKDCTNALLWSKPTLTTGSVGGAGVDPPPWKTDTIFIGSLALSVSIYRNFQSNVGKWPRFKLWTKKNYTMPYYIFFSTSETSPFSSIWLEISVNWHPKSQGPKI